MGRNWVRSALERILSADERQLSESCIHQQSGFPFITFTADSNDPSFNNSINSRNQREQFEAIYDFRGNLWIEPRCGFVISGQKVLRPSLSNSIGMPIPFRSIAEIFLGKHSRKVVEEDEVVSLHEAFDSNYFHFFNDVLTKLELLRQFRPIDQLPIVVSARLFHASFFQVLWNRGYFSNVRLIVQEPNVVIKANRVLTCKSMPCTKDYLDAVLDKLQIPAADGTGSRIFMYRKHLATHGRELSNLNEVLDVCREHGFVAIDPGTLSLDEQIDTFRNCRYLVGIHGAGLTNMIFRRENPLGVLEIFPEGVIPPHYYWLSKIFNYQYDFIVGSRLVTTQTSSSFHVDASILGQKLQAMLGAADSTGEYQSPGNSSSAEFT